MAWTTDNTRFAITISITLVTIAVTLTQFFHTYALSVRQPFLAKQTELCIAASESAARLATGIAPDPWRKARDDFNMLFWGPLYMVEDVESRDTLVKTAMFDFRRAFEEKLREKLKKGPSDDLGNEVPPLPLLSDLQYEAKKISEACQKYLASKWTVGILGWLPWPAR